MTVSARDVAVGILLAASSACSAAGHASPTEDPDQTVATPPLHVQFTADPAIEVGYEAYVCYSFEVSGTEGLHLGGVVWHPPSGAVLLHHASLFAAAGLPAVGEVSCDPMPERIAALGVYTPGAMPLELPPNVAIALPPGTERLLVLAHVMRVAAGAAQATSLDLIDAVEPVEHTVNWVDVFGTVPVIPPHEQAHSIRRCQFAKAARAVTTWPHMHRFGSEFHGAVIRADGSRVPIVDVNFWDYNHQLTYPIDISIGAGDSVETGCYWENSTADPVVPGPYSTNEMCNQGLFVWPFDSATCTPD